MVKGDLKDLVGGGLLGAIGLIFVVKSFDLGIGSFTRMEPGFFPLVVGSAACLVAAGLIVQAFGRAGRIEGMDWRGALAVSAGLVAFGLMIGRFGLAPAILSAVILSALGDRRTSLIETAVLAAVLCLAVWLIFSVGLGLAVPLVRGLG